MFIKNRKLVNRASGYEEITDPEDEGGEEQYSPDSSSDLPEDSPVIPDSNKEGPKYVC